MGNKKAQTLKVNLPSEFKVMEKENVVVAKEKKVVREKKVDNSVQQISINFKTEDLSNTNTRFQKPQYQQKEQNKKQGGKKINIEDLPSL